MPRIKKLKPTPKKPNTTSGTHAVKKVAAVKVDKVAVVNARIDALVARLNGILGTEVEPGA